MPFPWCFLAVVDLRAKVAFRQQTRAGQLKPNYGRWRWKETNPKPSWTALSTAPIWTEPQFTAQRASLAMPPAAVTPTATGDTAIQQLLLQSPTEPERTIFLTMYDATTDNVPPAIASNFPRAAVVLLDGSDYIAPHIKAQLEHIPVMVFGDSPSVHRINMTLQHDHPQLTQFLLWAYVKPRIPNFNALGKFVDRAILLVGDRNSLNFQVCPPVHPPVDML